ncbi:interleukin 1 receptor associated kinase 4 tube [Cochliomyia hominivorax]
MSTSYNRNTELRNVHNKDLYNLAVILEDDNYWQTLMEVIPKELNNQTFGTPEDLEKISSGAAYERKYSNDHIRLIENAIRRPGESRLYSQILFDEWGSSGRKHERPTLGVLLHLLVQSKLYRAADFVAELLNEPKPARPTNGPAAEFEFNVDDVFKDIQEAVNDTRFYPNTEDLQENVNNDINFDYYTKYQKIDKNIPTINDNAKEAMTMTMTTAPKPPPRLLKSARLLKQQQQQQEEQQQQQQLLILQQQQQQSNDLLQQTANSIYNTIPKSENIDDEQPLQILNTESNNECMSVLSNISTNNMPKLSALMNAIPTSNSKITTAIKTETATTNNTEVSDENILPKLSALNNSSERVSQPYEDEHKNESLNSIPSLIYTKPNCVEQHEQQTDLNSIPVVVLSESIMDCNTKQEPKSDSDNEIHDLPAISALNLNGERDDTEQLQHQIQNSHHHHDHHQHQQQSSHLENVPSVALNFVGHRRGSFDECAVNDEDLNIPCLVANMNFNENSSRHHLEAIEEDYNGIEHEHEHDNDNDVELEDDEDSIPNLSFLDNRSSNNESSLTSVTNTSGDNSFEHSVNDCSSTSTENVPCLAVLNQ